MPPRILGVNNTTAVPTRKPTAAPMFHLGQIGNSWRGCTKYCGPITVCITMNVVDTTRERNHSGAETYAMTPVMKTARCAELRPCHRNRRELMRLPWHQR